MIEVDRECCRDYSRSSKLEWLETNGTGGFAMGTAAGVSTRRYHALLTAALQPPAERLVLLSRLEETLTLGASAWQLGACQYPGVVAPDGFRLLNGFSPQPMPAWTWQAGEARITRQLFLPEGRPALIVRYECSLDAELAVRPFLAFRGYHSLARANAQFNTGLDLRPGALRMRPYPGLPAFEIRFPSGAFNGRGDWYYNVEYLSELDRGLDFREDLYSPGIITFTLRAGEPVWIVAGTESVDDLEPAGLYNARLKRPPLPVLEQAADAFRAVRATGERTLLAGFPWFTDWGRDAMISLPGLLLSRGLLDEAAAILRAFLAYRNQGLIPNRFPDCGEQPEYNTADATLWMFVAAHAYLNAGGSPEFIRDEFLPAALEILDWHRRGTWFGIGVDPGDGLLRAGAPGVQLTWMDARTGDHVVTPRDGKPVEINALWYNALRITAAWVLRFGDRDQAARLEQEAARVRASFETKFWNAERGCLYDVLGEAGPSAKIRPNQLFALSLPYPLIEGQRARDIVGVVERELLTPVGLRTLERGDAEYRPRYEGSPGQRDGAYHQGTVWPWLLGPFVDAYLAAFGETEETLGYCRGLAARLEQELTVYGLGFLAEVYDGDEPRRPGGCPMQAWSVAELLRIGSRLTCRRGGTSTRP